MSAAGAQAERHDFGAEVGRLLDLVVHSLYSDREIFLRELVANAADAIDRRRFEALTDPALALPGDAAIRLVADKDARTLSIADTGIGMSHDELVQNLGTIARSGTRAFGEKLEGAKPEDRPSLIGQFGVGFYSAFMVADRVEVTSRKAGAEGAWMWASDGAGAFTMSPAERDAPGTTIVLHMKPDADEFLDPMRIETIIRKWADHVTVPITLARDGKDQPINEGTALWRKSRSEMSEQSATAFYRHLGNIFDTPWATLHWKAEGTLEFFALLFIPGMKPFEAVEGERKSRVRLHVRRMFITDEAELLPPWLRFVQGVVDTEDLPLNVSREMLQSTPVLARIRRAVTSRVLSELKTRAKESEEYAKFWENFGPVLKEGIWEDTEHRKDLAELLRFRSSSQEGWVSLADYVGRMQPGQDAIFYLVGDDVDALRNSPQLEGFRAKGLEVLLLADPIDAFWPDRFDTFEDKPLRSITQSTADLFHRPADAEPLPDVSALALALKDALKGEVSDVRATDRLVDSAVVLAAGPGGPDLQMQRLLRRSGRGMPPAPPVLEINPRHALVQRLAGETGGEGFAETAGTLLDLARVQEGDLPRDPAAFARRVTAMLAGRDERR
ncbi:MAG: molecular chaperone HtpG [Alphaproteobacteria bacterium]|nr:molecular chaperone HtpG [Alphaproteobacteria bacterium]